MPDISFGPLHRADGSAEYSANGYTIIGSVNGPIEVPRKDELPEEAHVEVVVRPDVGVATVRERHISSIIEKTLRSVVLTHAYPRTLIQVTLQFISKPSLPSSRFSSSAIPELAPLLQTALLTLLSGSIPLSCTFTTVSLVEDDGAFAVLNRKNFDKATSVHAFAFTSNGDMLLAENEGNFSLETWQSVASEARDLCLATTQTEDKTMQNSDASDGVPLQTWLHQSVQSKVDLDEAWKT